MKAEEFIKELRKIFENEIENAEKVYTDNKRYTDFITEKLKEILKKDYSVSTEYFRVDVSAWKNKIGDNGSKINIDSFKLNKYLWDLEVAVEHENNSKLWMDEIVKLLHIRCPLRVVIGYLPVNCRENDLNYLEAIFYELDKSINVFHNNNFESEEFIVIIGNSKCKCNLEYFGYKAYKLTSDGFKEFI